MIRFTWSREIPRCWHLSSLWLLISMRSLLYFLKTMNRQLCADALPHIYASSNPSVEIEVAEIVKIVVGRVVEATMFGYSLQVTFNLLACVFACSQFEHLSRRLTVSDAALLNVVQQLIIHFECVFSPIPEALFPEFPAILLAFFLESDGQSLDVLAHLTPKFFNRNRLTKGILTEL